MSCPVTKRPCERTLECFHRQGCVSDPAAKAKQKPPAPKPCPHCRYMPPHAVTVCKRCGKDYLAPVHPGDRLVAVLCIGICVALFGGWL